MKQPTKSEQDSELNELQTWETPKLTEFGVVSELTQHISYNPLDGISNLT